MRTISVLTQSLVEILLHLIFMIQKCKCRDYWNLFWESGWEGDDDEEVKDGAAHNCTNTHVTLERDTSYAREQLWCRGT